MDGAPEDVGQTAAVPEAAHQKGEEEIQAAPPLRHPVAAERDVDIVPEPGGQGDMPAAPKFLDGKGEVWAFEVNRKLYAEKLCTADGNVRIPRKIAVDFDSEHHRDNDKHKAHIAVCIVVNFIHRGGEHIRDHQLFKISPGHQLEAVGHIVVIKAPLLFELGQQDVRPAYGACQKLGKKGDEEGVVTQMPLCLDFPFIHINQISHRLEEIEGNACGQQDFHGQRLHGQAAGIDETVDLADDGSAQLKDQKDAHKGHNAAKQADPLFRLQRGLFQTERQKVGQNGGAKQQKAVSHMQIHVKGIACRQQENPSKSDRHDMIQDKSRQ